MGNKKTAKKAQTRATKLRKSLASVRKELAKSETKLEKANAKASRWKEEAASHRASAKRSALQVKRLEEKLGQAAAARDTGPVSELVEPTSREVRVPDDTWTVVQLRSEARARGLSGLSNKPKAQLLAALS